MEEDTETKVYRMRAGFQARWREQFPTIPPPPIRALAALGPADGSVAEPRTVVSANQTQPKDGSFVEPKPLEAKLPAVLVQRNFTAGSSNETEKGASYVPFDKWLSSGAVDQLRHSYRCTEEKIEQLQDQLARKICLRDFLADLLECLDGSAPESAKNKSNASTSAIRRTGFSETLAKRTNLDDNSSKSAADLADLSANRPTHTAAGNIQQVEITGEVKGHTGPCNRSKENESTVEGLARTIGQAKQTTLSPCTKLDRCVTSECRHSECAGCVTRALYTGNGRTTEHCQPCATLKHRQHQTCEYSPQRGALQPAFTDNEHPDRLGVKPSHDTRVKTANCATQTDFSAAGTVSGYLDFCPTQCIDASTNTTAMFWNRKKASSKKADELGGRDNSGILGRYSDTGDTLPVPPPPKPDSHTVPRNVQYLKLTDGFGFVLQGQEGGKNTDPAQKPATPKLGASAKEQSLDVEVSQFADDEEIYDNNSTLPTRAQWYAVSSLGGREKQARKEESVETHKPQSDTQVAAGSSGRSKVTVTKSPSLGHKSPSVGFDSPSSSPKAARPAPRAPVHRVNSDTTGRQSPSLERRNPPGESSPKPQPHPRRKIPPPLPAKHKPQGSSVFYVGSSATQGHPLHSNQDNVAGGKREEGAQVERDANTSTFVDSGRGQLNTITAGVLQHEKHTADAHAEGGEEGSRADDKGGEQKETAAEQRADGSEPQRAAQGFTTPSTFGTRKPEREINQPDSTETKAHAQTHGQTEERLSHITHTDTSDKSRNSVAELSERFRQRETESHQDSDTVPRARQQQQQDSHGATRPQSAVGEPCSESSVLSAAGLNPCLASGDSANSSASGENSAAVGSAHHEEDMSRLRFNKHNLHQRNHSHGGELAGGVYKKTEHDTLSRKSDPTILSDLHHSGVTHPVYTHKDVAETKDTHSHTESARTEEYTIPPPDYDETDIDAAVAAEQSAVLRPVRHRDHSPPPVAAKPRRGKPRANEYENWTINRAITQQVDSNSDEDDDDSDNTSNASPGGTLDRLSATGSKDSGLCLEPPSSASSEGRGLAEARGKEFKSSMDELQQFQGDEEDYVHPPEVHADDANNDDSVSIASDIVFFRGSDVPGSPDPFKRHHDSSEDDEERYSPPSVDSSYDEADGEVSKPASPRDNMLKMRHLLIVSVLDTERTYLAILELLLHYKRTLEASCKTSQPVISEEKIDAIFGNLQEVCKIHTDFVSGLQAKIDKWSPEQTIGDIFKQLVFMFPRFGQYAANYQNAVAAIHECSKENSRFQELAQQIVLTSTTREVTSLEDALFKPVQRLQRNTLVLHDVIKHTPKDHPDYDLLQKALNLSQHNLENFGTAVVGKKVEEKRYLVKSSFLVELVGGWRKLRYIFLFSDVLACTKREQHRGGKVSFDCKWFIPMSMLRVDTKFSYQDDMKFSKKDDIDDLKKKLRGLKSELKKELKKDEGKDKHWSISGMAASRTVEKLKKKINELEAQLILSSPKLPFKVWHDQGKTHTLLMTTDYEREEWRETITGLRRKSSRVDLPTLSAYDVQEMVNSVKELPQVNKLGTALTQKDEETIYGTLNVTIHKMNGLTSPCDTYCCLEMDSYGHFFMKARTHICENSADPSWNEDFELELEGSQTLRVLCYRKGAEKQGDVLLGRGALEMNKGWLKGSFQERTVALGDYSLVLSVQYTAADKTMRRTPSKQSAAVFGVKISVCAKREGKTVPTIITACVQEVEKRGMEETGIYRVSGVTSDVQRLKKLFDKNVKIGAANLGDVDIHSVTGVVKLYLRELPEPLFTDASYTNFVDALKLSDDEAKEKCMLQLLHNLPDTNYYTIVYLLEHLLKVSKCVAENKMTIHNLSTIFGPTLLAPAAKDAQISPQQLMSMGAEHAMKQSAIVYYFLSLLTRGCSLRKSAQN